MLVIKQFRPVGFSDRPKYPLIERVQHQPPYGANIDGIYLRKFNPKPVRFVYTNGSIWR